MIFVSVGTTRFEELVKRVDEAVPDLGEEVIFQIGTGIYKPKNGSYIRLTDDLSPYYREASLVICHGGTGAVFESLEAGCKVVAVDNPFLQEGHQRELLEELEREGVIVWCRDLRKLKAAIKKAQALPPYKKPGSDLAHHVKFALSGRGGRRR